MTAKNPNLRYNLEGSPPKMSETVHFQWSHEGRGSWCKIRIIEGKDMKKRWDIIEEITEEEYFKRKLHGKL